MKRFLSKSIRGEILWLRALLHLLVIVGLLAALGINQLAEDYFTRGVAAGYDDLQPIPHTDVNPMGVNTFLDLEADPEVVEQSMDMIAEAGFGYIRQVFGWFDIEPEEKGVYQTRFGASSWEKFDRIVELANERDIEVVARLEKPPRWARAGQPNLEQFPDGPPNRMSDWTDYIEAVVTRYQGQILYYQIWNEPNLEGEWGGQPIDPRAYVDLLQAAYETIERIDPDAVVLLAGLAPTDQTGPTNLSDLLFLERVYEYGGAAFFDIATVMVYGYGYSPFDRRVSFGRNNFSRPIQTREIMVENGDAETPIWAVEYGWVSLPDDWAGEPSPWGEPVSEASQAEYLVDGYLRAQREWPWMGAMVVWAFRWTQPPDDPDQVANPTRGFALVNHDFTTRPSYEALAEAAPAIQRQGTGEYDVSDAMQERARIGKPIVLHIRGERLDLTFQAGDGGAVAVEIDGHSSRTFDLDAGGSQRITVARDLPDGPHDIAITVLSEPTGDPPALVRYTVSRFPVTSWIFPWLDATLILALFLTAFSFVWTMIDWRRARQRSPEPASEPLALAAPGTVDE